jgi:suppressor of G2 allele of SKP1
MADTAASRKPRFEYYQTQSAVTITLLARDADPSASTVEVVGDRHVSVSLSLPSQSTFVLDLDLYDAVVPGQAQTSYRPAKVEVKLAKAPAAQYMWPALEASAAAAVPPDAVKAKVGLGGGGGGGGGGAAAASAPSAPAPVQAAPVPAAAAAAAASAAPASASSAASASAPKQKKDWSALEKELAAEEEGEKPEGEEALYKLFRQIYKNGDEDTRRAMIKSFQTSGGTVLSTNWGEVAKKDYEKEGIQPPEGMEARKWEQ